MIVATMHGSPYNSHAVPAGRQILDSLRRLVQALRVSSIQAQARAGVSGAQLFVLQVLAEHPRPLSVNELAERTLTHQSSVSAVVGRLASHGLARRSRSPRDGRRVELSITAAGRRALARAPAAAQERLISGLGRMRADDRGRLAALLMELLRRCHLHEAPAGLFFEAEHGKGRSASAARPSAGGRMGDE